jgi:glutaminyl-peptide cyclotransferase
VYGFTVLLTTAIMTVLLTACNAQPSPQSPFNADRAYADLERIVAIGPRVAGTEGSKKTQALITAGLTEAGLEVQEHPFSAFTPMGVRSMNNIVGVIQGTKPGVIILSNHYDTKYFRDITFVGANDGGSTTAWMLEMALTLGPNREGHTVWLVFFDGEEALKTWSATDSLYGSREMAMQLSSKGQLPDIKAMINVDMIGDCDLSVMRDPEAPNWLQDIIWSTSKELGHASSFVPYGSQGLQDDHIPFRRAGVDSINLIDFRYGGDSIDHNKNWHTVNDTLDKVCAESLQVMGDVMYHSLTKIDAHGASTTGEK